MGCESRKGGRVIKTITLLFAALIVTGRADNTLTEAERHDGRLLFFDGKTHKGWMNSDGTAPRTPIEEGALNPHGAGHFSRSRFNVQRFNA